MSVLESCIRVNTDCGVCRLQCDAVFSIVYATENVYPLLGYKIPVAEKENVTLRAVLSEKSFDLFQETVRKHVHSNLHSFDFEFSTENTNKAILWLILKCVYEATDNTLSCIIMDVSKQKEREEVLRISEEVYRIAAKHYNLMLMRYSLPDNVLTLPKDVAAFFGMPEILPNWPHHPLLKQLIPESSQKNYIKFFEEIQAGKPEGSAVSEIRDKDGNIAWYNAHFTMVYDYKDEPYCGVISSSDVTEQREKELAHGKWMQSFRSQEADSIGYYESNLSEDIFEKVSGVLEGLLPRLERAPFSRITQYVSNHLVFHEDREKYLAVFNCEWLLQQYAVNNRKIQLEHRRVNEAGNIFWAKAVLQMFNDPYSNDIKCFTLIQDIDHEKRTRMELEERSQVDMLTGLFNRVTTIDKIKVLLADEVDKRHAFVMIDIDYFKQLNDNLGHAFGDTVLREIADVLRNSVRANDVTGRLGGDEFVIFMQNIRCDTDLMEKMQAICTRLRKEYADGITITGSLGVSIFPADGRTFEELYLCADTALYEAKRHGRNQFYMYSKP